MRRFPNPAVLSILVVLAMSLSAPVVANHSVSISGALLCLDGGEIEIAASEDSALGIEFTAQLFDVDGANLLASGDTHTFTAVDEPYVFTIEYEGLLPGVDYTITISDNPPEVTGVEGGHVRRTLRRCFLPVELESFTIE
jgi:hypothetical protein